jgi:hypothetical protein
MMDGFIRRLNRGNYDREFQPMLSNIEANRRGLMNEVAFELVCRVIENQRNGGAALDIEKAIAGIVPIIQQVAIHGERDGSYDGDLRPMEIEDVKEQARRLLSRLDADRNAATIVCKPTFRGCGMLDRCEGDVVVGKTLFEVKAGERPFRSIDLRQALTYLALNHAGNSIALDTIGMINPRVGISFEMPIDEFCFEVSGRDSAQLFDAMIHSVTSGDVSR